MLFETSLALFLAPYGQKPVIGLCYIICLGMERAYAVVRSILCVSFKTFVFFITRVLLGVRSQTQSCGDQVFDILPSSKVHIY